MQLARSEAIWHEVGRTGRPALRWYSYDTTALILGVGQRDEVADLEACQQAGVEVMKRATGGGAVLATPHLLALDVALPAGHPLAMADVVDSYRWIGHAFLQALERVAAAGAGKIVLVPPDVARADQAAQRGAPAGSTDALRGLACYGTLSPYELAVVPGLPSVSMCDSLSSSGPAGLPASPALAELAGHHEGPSLAKLVGLSQLRKRGVTLMQAGLYLHFESAALVPLLRLPEEVRGELAQELDRRIGSLELCLPAVSASAVAAVATSQIIAAGGPGVGGIGVGAKHSPDDPQS